MGACSVNDKEPNDTPAAAIPYSAGTPVVGCLATTTDVDYYEFTSPADPAGGYYIVGLDDVGAGYPQFNIYAVSDNGVIDYEYTSALGGSLRAFFAAAPGQRYQVAVTSFAPSSGKAYKYTLMATYTKVGDDFEPNDTRAAAKSITVGNPITARFFTGYTSSKITDSQYADFFKVTLAAGTVTVKFSDGPSDLYPDLSLLDADGARVDNVYSLNQGANVGVMMKTVISGDYFVQVGAFAGGLNATGKGIMLPDHFTHPYTLTVSQP